MAEERIAEQRAGAAPVAETEYTESDGQPISENTRHGAAIVSLRNALQLHYHGRGDLLLYREAGNRKKSIGPDILVALGVPEGRRASYQVWRKGKVPDSVMEVSSPESREGDRSVKRERYESLGVGEYFLYDPGYDGSPGEMRAYRLWGGQYVEERRGGEEEVQSAVLELGFRGEGDQVRVRDLRTGEDLPSLLELERSVEAEARARKAAEARVAELESLLRAGGPGSPPRDGSDGPAGRETPCLALRLTFESSSAGN